MHGGSSANRKKRKRLWAFQILSSASLKVWIIILKVSFYFCHSFLGLILIHFTPLLWKTHLYQQILPSHCWGDDIVMLFWYFDTTIKSLADTMTQRWLFRLRDDDDGSGRIREKWFRNHFMWREITSLMMVKSNTYILSKYESISEPENHCFEFLI